MTEMYEGVGSVNDGRLQWPEEDRPVDSREVGVGPWPGGEAQWPDDPRLDPELLANGDQRNVVDRFRYWRVDAIKKELERNAHPLHVAIENLSQDFNIGSIVRTANAFNVGGVHIVGKRRWNKRGAMVTNRYLRVYHHETPAEMLAWASEHGLTPVAIDNGPGSELIETAQIPEHCLLVMGSEREGISEEFLAGCKGLLRIGQYGSTRSINVAAAGAIAMHSWMLQHAGEAPD